MKFLLVCLIFALSTTSYAVEPSHVPLFNGKDLTGWTQKGGQAKFSVENGEIVGTTVANTPNSFLCTEKHFANFILELDFKVDRGLNSGVQIRSLAGDQSTEQFWNGKTIKIPPGRVHGLQVEIDPSPRAWTGGIHGEGGGGWLNDLKNNEPARQAFKQDEWNHLKVHAEGSTVKTWINGVPAADLQNDVILTGFIGLQVHEIGKKEATLQVRFKNLHLQELP
jgi:hypothetical protein